MTFLASNDESVQRPALALISAHARQAYFLPYQEMWLRDSSRLKIWVKSRRIGATYVQAYEDVADAASGRGMDVWFSSADESAAKEYIRYCIHWAELLNLAAQDLGEIALDADNGVKAQALSFANGHRIHGISSNPRAFRSKGGKLVLDEFAFHQDARAMWKAAAPIVTWGYPVRLISSCNGKHSLHQQLSEQADHSDSPWSLHKTTIRQAVDQGLADRIKARPLKHHERDAFIEECRAIAGNEDAFREEYLCEASDSKKDFLEWQDIMACEHALAGREDGYQGGICYGGMDIGLRHDRTVIWIVEQCGDVFWTREVVALHDCSFAQQDATLHRLMNHYRVGRLAMDRTGIGERSVEQCQQRYGQHCVEGVQFTLASKKEMATTLRNAFMMRQVRIPEDETIRKDHHTIRKTVTAAGHVRFDARRTQDGHGDYFWAHALAFYAAGMGQHRYDYVNHPASHLFHRESRDARAIAPYSRHTTIW